MTNVKCFACGKSFALDNVEEGQKTHCVYCGKLLKLIREQPPVFCVHEVTTNEPIKPAAIPVVEKKRRRLWWTIYILQAAYACCLFIVSMFAVLSGLFGLGIIATQNRLSEISGGDAVCALFMFGVSACFCWILYRATQKSEERKLRSGY